MNDKKFNSEMPEADLMMAKRIAEADKKSKKLSKQLEDVAKREAAVTLAELSLDEELQKKRIEFDAELLEQKKKAAKEAEALRSDTMQKCHQMITEAEKQLSEWRKEQSEEFMKSLEEERKSRLADIQIRLKELESESERLAQENRRLKDVERDLAYREDDFRFRSARIEAKSNTLDRRYQELEDNAKQRAEEIFNEKYVEIISENKELNKRCQDLREKIESLNSRLAAYSTFETIYGASPDVIKKQLKENETELSELRNQLANAPSPEIVSKYNNLQQDYNEVLEQKSELQKENGELIKKVNDSKMLEAKIALLEQTVADKDSFIEHRQHEIYGLNDIIRGMQDNINRLRGAAEQSSSRKERLRAMFNIKPTQLPFDIGKPQTESETMWLNGIQKKLSDIQMEFPKRILYAFHTALKIADWSIITVLAGVSGTGKSELPRLYSEFGGINFINVPVQPNWDSQEAMLGYYNSIDNMFDAQPLLQFLVQATEGDNDSDDSEMKELLRELEESGYVPNDKYMSLVLLDEMNLAHVELYFAEFLSKLENRRGKSAKFSPTIEVKLGAGIKPYELKLSRNVLWTGSMNQDETTQSLSDKVLDRGVVINFPRPTVLKERDKHFNIDKTKKDAHIAPLSRETWESWQVMEIAFTEKQREKLLEYKSIVEKINDCLTVVGRAVGHRVWQSIEYYIANYPDVLAEMSKNECREGKLTKELEAAMNIAFEDQIVQKIMPKLRGIETRGTSKTDCLDRIKSLLEDSGFGSLSDDFEQACRLGYGQFIWCSANYLND